MVPIYKLRWSLGTMTGIDVLALEFQDGRIVGVRYIESKFRAVRYRNVAIDAYNQLVAACRVSARDASLQWILERLHEIRSEHFDTFDDMMHDSTAKESFEISLCFDQEHWTDDSITHLVALES